MSAASLGCRVVRGGSAAVLAACLAACAHKPPPPMYLWESFPRMQYDALLTHGNTPNDQVSILEAQAEKARAEGAALPPGFRAHWGMLKLAAGDTVQARQLWLDEKVAFPESTPYMDQLLKRLDGPTAASAAAAASAPAQAKKDNPA